MDGNTVDQHSVLTALRQQVQCYRDLSRLTIAQHEDIKNGRTQELLSVLAQKQELLDQIADLNQTISPAKKRWVEFLQSLDSQSRSKAESIMQEIGSLLEKLMESDRNDSIILQQRKHGLAMQINQITNARMINRKYAGAAYGRQPTAVLDLQR